MAYKGIDVSSYQGNIDWSKVKWAGVQFAILKIIRKDLNPDKTFEQNWKGCTDVGMPIQGVYNYSYATTVDKAKTDANKVIQTLNGRKTFVWLSASKGSDRRLLILSTHIRVLSRVPGLTLVYIPDLAFIISILRHTQIRLIVRFG